MEKTCASTGVPAHGHPAGAELGFGIGLLVGAGWCPGRPRWHHPPRVHGRNPWINEHGVWTVWLLHLKRPDLVGA